MRSASRIDVRGAIFRIVMNAILSGARTRQCERWLLCQRSLKAHFTGGSSKFQRAFCWEALLLDPDRHNLRHPRLLHRHTVEEIGAGHSAAVVGYQHKLGVFGHGLNQI